MEDKSKKSYGFGSSSVSEYRESDSSSSRSSSESSDENKNKECSPLGWPIRKAHLQKCYDDSGDENKTQLGDSKKKQDMSVTLAGKYIYFLEYGIYYVTVCGFCLKFEFL